MDPSEFRLVYFDADKTEKLISNRGELYQALIELEKSAGMPKSFNLLSPNGDILTVALAGDFGFVQFEAAASASPYMIAIDKQKKSLETYRDVDAGGTPTPIPERACLPPQRITEIVLYYFDRLIIPEYVEWEPI